MSVGAELREARERVGLTTEEIAERTKVQLNRIEALESDRFDVLPHGIYLEGMVRAYAKEVGVDDKSLIERFRVEQPEALRTPLQFVDLATVATPSEWNLENSENPLDEYRSEPVHDPIAPPPEHRTVQPSQRRHRFALALVSLIAVAGWGAFLYETTRTIDHDIPRGIGAPDVPVPHPVPPPQTTTSGETPATVAPSVPDSTSSPVTPTTPVVVPPTTPSAKTVDSDVAASIPDVSGAWALTTFVERSSYAAFEGLQLGYELTLEQNGKRITGAGRKVTENGHAIGSGAQTPITVDGTIEGHRLTLAFAERGTERSTEGRFVLLLDESGILRGRFSSTAAQSSGRVEVRRVQ